MFPSYNPNTQFSLFALTTIASAAIAGCGPTAVGYPLIYAHTALAGDIGVVRKYTGIVDCIVKTVKQNGVLSLYKGFFAPLGGILIYRGVQIGLYDVVKKFNPSQKLTGVMAILSKFITAQAVTALCSLAAYPLDTIQRRLLFESTKPK